MDRSLESEARSRGHRGIIGVVAGVVVRLRVAFAIALRADMRTVKRADVNVIGGLDMRIRVFRSMALMAVIALGAGSAVALAQGGGGGGQGRGGGRGPQAPPLVMTTTSFEDGGIIPAKFAGQMGVSPELKWTQVPMGTQSFVLLMHDPDVALQRNTLDVTHWIIWNIPGT